MIILNNFSFKNYTYSPSFSANPQKIVKQTAPKISVDEVVNSILSMFNGTPESLPAHCSPLVAKSSNSILGISLKTKKGNDLTVIKVLGSNLRQGLRYLSFAEKTQKGKRVNTISIDLENNEFLKLGIDNKPVVKDDNVHYYSAQDLKTKKINKKFAEYVNLIFSDTKSESLKHDTVFLNKRGSNKVSDKIVEDAVDIDLFKRLDKEFKDEIDVITTEEAPSLDCII